MAIPSGATLFQGATIISFDDARQALKIINNGSLLVHGGRICGLSEGAPTFDVPPGTDLVDSRGRIISPGFIDTHHHLWQSTYRTLAADTNLTEYFMRYSPFGVAKEHFTAEDVYVGQLSGALELINEGTTSVLDHAHGVFSEEAMDNAVQATFDSGLRVFFAQPVLDASKASSSDMTFAKFKQLAQDPRFADSKNPVTLGLAYDTFQTTTPEDFSVVWKLVQEYNLSVLTTHFLGGPWDATNSPTLLHEKFGILDQSHIPIVFSHASFLTPMDAHLLRKTNHYVSTTPESELHYGHGNPCLHLIQDQAALGVDTHCTFSSSMVQQARIWLQQLRGRAYANVLERWRIPQNNPMNVEKAFLLITRNGGLALNRPDLGVIRVGAKADIVSFATEGPSMWATDKPSADPIAAIILHSNPGDIRDVMVDGRFVKRNGKLLHPGLEAFKDQYVARAARIQAIWKAMPPTELPATFANGFSNFEIAKEVSVDRPNQG